MSLTLTLNRKAFNSAGDIGGHWHRRGLGGGVTACRFRRILFVFSFMVVASVLFPRASHGQACLYRSSGVAAAVVTTTVLS